MTALAVTANGPQYLRPVVDLWRRTATMSHLVSGVGRDRWTVSGPPFIAKGGQSLRATCWS